MLVHNRRYLCKATKDLLQKKIIHESNFKTLKNKNSVLLNVDSAERCQGDILEPVQAKRRRGKINDCRLESFDSVSDGDGN
jgi:hypothetical protein